MSNQSEPEDPRQQLARLDYIGAHAHDLAKMADAGGFRLVSYLLRMVVEEVKSIGEREADRRYITAERQAGKRGSGGSAPG
jgi:hypothetical protein